MIPLNRMKANGKVDLWDLGPQVAPKAPPAPESPDEKLKGGELAAAQVAYEDACEIYKDELRRFNSDRKAHLEWAKDKGGPIKVEFWGADATAAMEIEPRRYVLDLPRGVKPGKAQLAAEEMQAAEAAAMARARSQDPMHAGAMQ